MDIAWISDFDSSKPKSGLESIPYNIIKEITQKNYNINFYDVRESWDNTNILGNVAIVDLSKRSYERRVALKLRERGLMSVRFARDCNTVHSLSFLKRSININNVMNMLKSLIKDSFLSLQGYDYYVFVNERDASFYKLLFPLLKQKIFNINVGVNTSIFYPNNMNKKLKKELLFVGPFSYEPNRLAGEFIINKISKKYEMEGSLYFHIVGSGWGQMYKYQSNIKNVLFDDYIEDIASVYRDSWAFIAPIFVGSGMKNKILEAMASGLPVLGTREAFSGINVENLKSCIVCETQEEFLNGIRMLIDEPVMFTNIAKAGREIIEKQYTWEIAAKQLLEIVEKTKKSSDPTVKKSCKS